MNYSWSKNLYDYEGDCYDNCVLVFAGDTAILKFENPDELEQFAKEILESLKEIKEKS